MRKEAVYGFLGLVIGAAAGAYLTYKLMYDQIQADADAMIEEVKATYEATAKKHKTGPYAKLEDIVASYKKDHPEYVDKVNNLGYIEDDRTDLQREADAIRDAIIYSEAVSRDLDDRSDEELGDIFVIDHQQYFEDYLENNKTSITYYAGDDTLTDEREQPMPDFASIVGEDWKSKFGYSDDDPEVVYVRNLRIGIDFEINRDPGKYSVIVLGHEIEEQETRKSRKTRRMREDV